MDARDFLDLAVRLSGSNREADIRTSVSRAYYGVYHLAAEFIRQSGIHLPGAGEAHDKLVWCLRSGGVEESESAAVKIGSLRKERNSADYDLNSTKFRSSLKARMQLTLVQEIMAALAACDTEPTRTEVRAKMRSFAKNTLRLIVDEPDE